MLIVLCVVANLCGLTLFVLEIRRERRMEAFSESMSRVAKKAALRSLLIIADADERLEQNRLHFAEPPDTAS
jgi:hypothetical protein